MRTTLVGAVLGVIALTTVGASSCSSTGGTASDTSAPATTDTPTAVATAAAAPKTLFTFSGSGIKNTADFTVPAEWVLNWTYNCSNFGGNPGNFQVMEYNADGGLAGLLANELGKGGPGTSNQHNDAGSKYLTVNSECHWTVTAVG
jgi:hypothetical protein